jgi:hypothetical protein
VILFGGPIASMIVSPRRHAGMFSIITVGEPSMTTPGPCGTAGHGVVHAWRLAPPPAAAEIAAPIAATAAVFAASAATLAGGPAGVPDAAFAAFSAVCTTASDTCFAA